MEQAVGIVLLAHHTHESLCSIPALLYVNDDFDFQLQLGIYTCCDHRM